jgi:hypothetical protein
VATLLSVDYIRSRLSSEQVEELSVLLGVCFECGGRLKRADGEVVCEKCGRVWGFENVDENIPFPESGEGDSDGAVHFEGHWQPGSSLCFLKGLGDPALDNVGRGRGLMRVLAKARAKGEDLGIRARLIRVITQMEDPPQLRRILTRISVALDQLGMRDNYEVADYAGSLARKVVGFAIIANVKIPTRMADALVKHILNKFGIKGNCNEQILNYKEEDLQFVEWFEEAIQKFRLKEANIMANPKQP